MKPADVNVTSDAPPEAPAFDEFDPTLLDSESYFQSLFQQSPLGITVEDYSSVKTVIDQLQADGVVDLRRYFEDHPILLYDAIDAIKILLVNDKFVNIIGLPSTDAYVEQHDAIARWWDPKKADYYLNEIIALTGPDMTFAGYYWETRPDGVPIKVKSATRVLKGSEDTWSRVIATHEDITEQMVLEDALRENEYLYREAASLAKLGHWIWDHAQCAYVNVSTECHRMHGVSLAEYTQHKFPDAFSAQYIHPGDRLDFLRTVKSAMSAQRSFDVEYRCIMPDSDLRTIHAIGEPMMDNSGDHVRTICTVQDVTVRKKMEENLRQSHVMYAIGQLAAGISHNFNNLLLPILCLSDGLLNRADPESEDYEDLNVITIASRQARDLVSRIVEFSHKSQPTLKRVDACSFVTSTLTLARVGLPSSITLEHRLDDNAGMVLVDEAMMSIALINLIKNGIDAIGTDAGKIQVHLSRIDPEPVLNGLTHDLKLGPSIKMSVIDTGCGMDENTLKHVLDPFFTTKDVGAGTGLGLSTTQGIVASHGGDLLITNNPGVGTTADIFLPLG